MGKIWLIGMMGSGKSTVAPLVGLRLGWTVLDTDSEVARSAGHPVDGWMQRDPAGFREAERGLVIRVAAEPGDRVVACGGGVVLDADGVRAMRGSGMVAWLDAPLPALVDRVGSGSGRPLLDGDVAGALQQIRAERSDRYLEAAHVMVAAGGSPEETAEEVVVAWTNWS